MAAGPHLLLSIGLTLEPTPQRKDTEMIPGAPKHKRIALTTDTPGKYHYRTPLGWDGCTRASLKYARKHLHKVGQVTHVVLYKIQQHKLDTEGRYRVMVYGTEGTARFGGFSWGYWGEGPRGLMDLLGMCGMTGSDLVCEIEMINHEWDHGRDFRCDKPVTHWRTIHIHPNTSY